MERLPFVNCCFDHNQVRRNSAGEQDEITHTKAYELDGFFFFWFTVLSLN